MISTTIGALLDGAFDDEEAPNACIVYVVREDSLIFYVGESGDVLDRLNGHLGQGYFGWASDSVLGRLVHRNLPSARAWQVELFTEQDCVSILEAATDLRFEADPGFPGRIRVKRPGHHVMLYTSGEAAYRKLLECLIITIQKPCLNTECNDHPTALPERYDPIGERSAAWHRAAALLGLTARQSGGEDGP